MNENKNLNECTAAELLEKLSGILDMAYELTDDQEERDYICNVENVLYKCLRREGVIV